MQAPPTPEDRRHHTGQEHRGGRHPAPRTLEQAPDLEPIAVGKHESVAFEQIQVPAEHPHDRRGVTVMHREFRAQGLDFACHRGQHLAWKRGAPRRRTTDH
ncbi:MULTISPECIES: hypothetical protein [Rhodococcus]|uniref:hypothetical protein n=1 Tax=Rhodococcus sp. IEGM 1307 TaxID=3047091 RepID=UPI0022F346C6|nr:MULTISPECIES: hypothetical protein [Rhodococcus]MDI9979478.1 hypothetical protein [Rhodococcus sp. IEGM 1307]GLK33825.1 hypothetical protein GCM10017611_06680 [Rhodococcus wratislaviensis]